METMNNTFSWHRFGQVLWHDMKNIWPRMGILMLCLIIPAMLVYLFYWVSKGEILSIEVYNRLGVILIMIMIVVVVAPSMLYKECNNSKNGIYFAMLPASKLEKYLSMLLMTIVIVPLLFTVSICMVDTIMWLFTLGDVQTETTWQALWQYLFCGWDGSRMSHHFLVINGEGMIPTRNCLWAGIGSYLLIQSIFLFSSTLFKRHKVINTILWLMLISIVCFWIIVHVIFNISNEIAMSMPQCSDDVVLTAIIDRVKIIMNVCSWMCIGVSAGLYIWTGFRLKKIAY